MAEAVMTQITEAPKDVLSTVKHKPVTALVVALIAVSAVVLLEIFFPGAITGRIRSLFTAVGVKKAGS